jgi:hypothetical protein
VQAATAGVVQAQGHAADSKAGPSLAPIAAWPRPIESAPTMEVLRWLLFFAIAIFVIVAGIFFVMGRPLEIPSF